MTIEKVKPVIVDGIEFYISNDGRESGMSISGLARFVGLSESRLRQGIVNKLWGSLAEENGKSTFQPLPDNMKSLKPFVDNVFSVRTTSYQNAKIIRSQVCTAIIRYVAFESDYEEEVKQLAEYCYHKFAEIGFHEWVKKSAGYIEESNENKLFDQLKQLYVELKSLDEFAKEYKVIKNTTTVFMPGVKDLLDDIVDSTDDDNLYLPTEDGALSIEGWLHRKGITLTSTKFRQLAHITAATFKSMTKQDPSKAHFKLANGKTKYNVSVYEPQHFAIIQMCFNKILHDD